MTGPGGSTGRHRERGDHSGQVGDHTVRTQWPLPDGAASGATDEAGRSGASRSGLWTHAGAGDWSVPAARPAPDGVPAHDRVGSRWHPWADELAGSSPATDPGGVDGPALAGAAHPGAPQPVPDRGATRTDLREQPETWSGSPVALLEGGSVDEPTDPHLAAPPAGPASRRLHPLRLVLYALVLAGLVAGSVAWLTMDKSVTLRVDGDPRSVHTYSRTVQGVLDTAGVSVGAHDVLAPGPAVRVSDGSEVVLRRGRLLRLTLDGRQRALWVTATNVQDALQQLGVRQDGVYLSASRSRRLPLGGLDLTVRMPKTVSVVADGRTLRRVSTAPTVGALFDEMGVRVGGDDRVSQLSGAPVFNGMTITVTRVRYASQVERTVLRYREIRRDDDTLSTGTTKVGTPGRDGLQEVTYAATYLNGKLATRKVLASRVVARPVDQVVLVGTKPAPAGSPGTGGGGGGPIPSTGGLNWAGLAQCESGGNPNAVNPSGQYYGLYQFDIGTWHSNGGTGSPAGASPAEQTRVANNLYQARGRSPWPVCGKYL